MLKKYKIALVALLTFAGADASALSCGIASEQRLVDGNAHIFFALVTSAVFVPYNDGSSQDGKVVAQFEVIEVLKGDPKQVPHIELKVRSADETWPAMIHLGRKYLVLSNGGPAHFTSCSDLFRATDRENWCLEYQIRKRVGQSITENAVCEAAHILRAMNRVGFKPDSARDDLQGLRREWIGRFGALPE